MCLTNQTEVVKLGKATKFWKVFRKTKGGKLETLYAGVPINRRFPANKPFESRFGYQVFKTRVEAREFSSRMKKNTYTPSTFPIKRVEAKRGALFREGVIGNTPGRGLKACRVSSLSVLD